MKILSVIRRKLLRPQFSLAALFALVTFASIPMAVPIWREKAYRERLAAASVLTDNTETYRVGVRRPGVVREIGDVGYDYQLLRADDLDREDEISVIASGNRVVSDEEISTISSFATLKSLDLSRCRVTDAQLTDIRRLRRLERLVLDETPVGDEGIANLGTMPSLHFLNLTRTRISDAAVEHFLSMPRLETLFVGGTNITDEGLRRLAAHTSLRQLGLGGTKLTDAGLIYLSRMPSLECVSYYGVKGVTSAGVARLKKLRPDLTGLWGEPLWDPSQDDKGGKPQWKRELDIFLESGSDDTAPKRKVLSP